MRTWTPALTLTVTLALAACGGAPAARDALTQRERDSILAQSRIPGARGVGAAMRVADSIEAKVRARDTIGQ
jgi:hypothetical protein